MKILFVCTSNKDRSPALEQFFTQSWGKHEYRSAGVNRYFTSKKQTHYLTQEDLDWADLIVCSEQIHLDVIHRDFQLIKDANKKFTQIDEYCVVLNCGDYKQGQVGEDYLLKAENKLVYYLK